MSQPSQPTPSGGSAPSSPAAQVHPSVDAATRLKRWRLLLGGDEADGTGVSLDPRSLAMDKAMSMLYDGGGNAGERRAGLGASAPNAARWLGDIREYFPHSVVRIMQKDAIDRLGMQRLLLEPEMLEAVQPDIHLVTTLMSLSGVIPQKAKRPRGRWCGAWSMISDAVSTLRCVRR